jgi:hypothetical protein
MDTRRRRRELWVAVLLAMAPAAPLLAYVDPGIAGMFYQIAAIIVGSIAAGFFAFRTFMKTRIFRSFRSRSKKASGKDSGGR